MSTETVAVKIRIDTSVVERRLRFLALLAEATQTAQGWEDAFKRMNQTVADFEREIQRVKGEEE